MHHNVHVHRTVGRAGILLGGKWYRAPEFEGRIGHPVIVDPTPGDGGRIHVIGPDGEFSATAVSGPAREAPIDGAGSSPAARDRGVA